MGSLLHLGRCCRIPYFKNYASVVFSKSFHSVSNETLLLKSRSPASSQVRRFWETFPHIRPLFYEKDGLSRKQYELVYHANLYYYVFYGQLIASVALAVQTFGALYFAYKSYVASEVIHVATQVGNYAVNYDLGSILIMSMLTVQYVLMFIAARHVVLRAYHCKSSDNPGELVPLKERMINFLLGNHRLNDTYFYIRCDQFKTMEHYSRLVERESE